MNKITMSILTLASLIILTSNVSCGKSSSSSTPSVATDDDDDDNSQPGGPTVMTEQGNFRIIFVTNTKVNGSGASTGTGSGIASFDALCESEKASHGLAGTFKALVYGTNRHPKGSDWVLRSGKEYRRKDLTTVIDTAEYTLAEGVTFPFIATPFVNTVTTEVHEPWTGFKNDWQPDSFTCSNWTRSDFDSTADTLGTYGKSSIKDEFVDLGHTSYQGGPLLYNNDVSGAALQCDSKHPVYCVQTKQLPPPGTKKILFMSTTTVRGDAGFSAFDAACAADAVTKGLTGTYKAVVGYTTPNTSGSPVETRRVCQAGDCAGATGMEQSLDWPMLPNTQYVREDRLTYIGKTNVHGYLSGELEEPIANGGTYWSGIGNGHVMGGAHQHCNGWVEPSFNAFTNEAGTQNADWGSATAGCTTARSVLCAEQ